jgi:hypothetical protein
MPENIIFASLFGVLQKEQTGSTSFCGWNGTIMGAKLLELLVLAHGCEAFRCGA